MKFRVYERGTNKDVTDLFDWFIDKEGKLLCMIDYAPVYIIEDKYYYKLEVTVCSVYQRIVI